MSYALTSCPMKKQDDLILLGNIIRSLRKSKGYSQEDFAFFIEVNRGYFGAIERGEVNVSFLNLIKIFRGLQVSPAIFFNKFQLETL